MVHEQGQQQCGLQTLCSLFGSLVGSEWTRLVLRQHHHEDVTLQVALLPVHCLLTHHLWASAWSLIQHNTSKTIEYVEPVTMHAHHW